MAKHYDISTVIQRKLSDDELRPYMHPLLVEIANVLGSCEKALRISRDMATYDFFVPKGVKGCITKSEQKLIDVIGAADAKKIIQRFGGDRLYIPNSDELVKKIRYDDFCKSVNQCISLGMTQPQAIRAVCIEFGVSERYAKDIYNGNPEGLRKMPKDDRQFELFNDLST